MENEDRMNVIIMGQKIGTATGWNDAGDNTLTFYDFISLTDDIRLQRDDNKKYMLNVYQTIGIFEIISMQREGSSYELTTYRVDKLSLNIESIL